MDKQTIETERRKQKRFELMGTNDPICLMCGGTTWYNFEGHHIAGKRYDKEAIEFFSCECHGDLTEKQRYHPNSPSARGSETAWECAMHFAYGLNDIFHTINRYLSEDHPSAFSDRRTALTYLRALGAFLKRANSRLKYHVSAVASEIDKGKARRAPRRGKPSKRKASPH